MPTLAKPTFIQESSCDDHFNLIKDLATLTPKLTTISEKEADSQSFALDNYDDVLDFDFDKLSTSHQSQPKKKGADHQDPKNNDSEIWDLDSMMVIVGQQTRNLIRLQNESQKRKVSKWDDENRSELRKKVIKVMEKHIEKEEKEKNEDKLVVFGQNVSNALM